MFNHFFTAPFYTSSCSIGETKVNPIMPCFPLRGTLRSSKGCTRSQVGMIINAELTAKRQISRRLVFTDSFVT